MVHASLKLRLHTIQQQRIATHSLRQHRTIYQRQGVDIQLENGHCVDFSSNDYLGLSQHPEVINAACETMHAFGIGARSAHLVSGHYAVHETLAQSLADWLGYEQGLVFGSGYMANLSIQQALLNQSSDACIHDRLNHASLIDASRLAHCRIARYRHADSAAAERLLQRFHGNTTMLITDGVFSMDGDTAPLHQLSMAARKYDALLCVDDAHGIGVVGPDGKGSAAAAGLCMSDVPLLLVTLGKAFGTYGAVVLGSKALITHLMQCARPYIYTTALPPAIASASQVSFEILCNQPRWRERLHRNIHFFQTAAQQRGIPIISSTSAIQGVLCTDNLSALTLAQNLESAGYFVRAMRPPTVPKGTTRLRVTLSALHTTNQINGLLDAFLRYLKQ